jgi:hypothetical protein
MLNSILSTPGELLVSCESSIFYLFRFNFLCACRADYRSFKSDSPSLINRLIHHLVFSTHGLKTIVVYPNLSANSCLKQHFVSYFNTSIFALRQPLFFKEALTR